MYDRPFYAYRSAYSVLRQLRLIGLDDTGRLVQIAKNAVSPQLRAQAQAVLTRHHGHN